MSVRDMRRAFAAFVVSAAALLLVIVALVAYAMRYPDHPLGSPGRPLKVVIARGANFPQVVTALKRSGLLSGGAAFRFYANYKGLASKVRAGTYNFKPEITPRELLNILVHGVPAPTVSVLIPEGKNMLEVAEILSAAQIAPKAALLAQMRNPLLLHRLGIQAETIEGYLFPDTYNLRAPSPPAEVLTKLHQRHRQVFYALRAKHRAGMAWLRKKLRWGDHEIVIMASIVEKETGQPLERPLIAGVFLNRLTLGSFSPRLLQTDPTIVYGCTVPSERSKACQRFEGRIRRIHLDDAENPYNTYTHTGLPPGPIANPGRAALEAVLAPQHTRYLYFVSKNDGTHQFSATRAEHEQAVDRYQRGSSAP